MYKKKKKGVSLSVPEIFYHSPRMWHPWWENLLADSKSTVHISAASGYQEKVTGLFNIHSRK